VNVLKKNPSFNVGESFSLSKSFNFGYTEPGYIVRYCWYTLMTWKMVDDVLVRRSKFKRCKGSLR
jgi:hypothetical protein